MENGNEMTLSEMQEKYDELISALNEKKVELEDEKSMLAKTKTVTVKFENEEQIRFEFLGTPSDEEFPVMSQNDFFPNECKENI